MAPPAAHPTRTRPGRSRAREIATLLHRVLGLTAGVVLVVIGLTGSALVFRAEIDQALNPALLQVAPAAGKAPLQAVVEAVERTYPGERPWRIRMPRTATGSYELWLGSEPSRYVYADPYRGTILGDRAPRDFLTGFLFQLHTTLLAGETGERVAGACALALVLLGASGLVAWWPGRGRLRPALTVAWRATSKRVNYDLHRSVGFYASGFLVLAGVTGASLVFHEGFQRAIYWVAATPGEPPAPDATAPPASAPLALDSLLRVAEQALPGGAISYLYLPVRPTDALRVRKRLPAELHPNGKSFVHLDPRSGAVLGVENGAAAPAGARAYSALYPLHIGSAGGIVTRVVGVVVGLTPALFLVTGVRIWRGGRRAGRPARARALTPGSPPPPRPASRGRPARRAS